MASRLWMTLFCLVPFCHVWAGSVTPVDLRCEYRVSPLGIDVPDPRLSWVLQPSNPAARGVRQSAYWLRVASSFAKLSKGEADLWDTGKVASDQSIQIVYRGKPFASGSRAWWQVQVWDQAGVSSTWSAPGFWSFGLQPKDWHARWIGLDESRVPKDRVLPARMLRKEFTLGTKPSRATVYVSGLGSSELYVNGSRIGDAVLSPGLTDYTKRVLYATYVLSSTLSISKLVA